MRARHSARLLRRSAHSRRFWRFISSASVGLVELKHRRRREHGYLCSNVRAVRRTGLDGTDVLRFGHLQGKRPILQPMHVASDSSSPDTCVPAIRAHNFRV
jgi:hypothetical protein